MNIIEKLIKKDQFLRKYTKMISVENSIKTSKYKIEIFLYKK